MNTNTIIFVLLIINNALMFLKAKRTPMLPILVKDVGVVEMKKKDVAMIFYVTVTNTGHEPIRLAVNGTRCCQLITKDENDCESMKLIGGDMGVLFPQDNRNLTLVYMNLYPHNRVGSCEVEIKEANSGQAMMQFIKFNTTLVKGEKIHVPRLLEHYYEPDDIMSCDGVEKDPMNRCKPYICDIRYDGVRSLFNYTTGRCQKIPSCGDPSRANNLVAYDVGTGTCKALITSMSERDYAQFKDGKPSIHTLSHEHGYPINVRCHNGKKDKQGHWCKCDEGWSSAAFDHKYFNPDIQVYHMCTVWTGDMNAPEAKNITEKPKPHHRRTNIIVFTFLALSFLLLLPLLAYLLYKLRLKRRLEKLDSMYDAPERTRLTGNN